VIFSPLSSILMFINSGIYNLGMHLGGFNVGGTRHSLRTSILLAIWDLILLVENFEALANGITLYYL